MRKATVIAFAILSIALLAAAIALWPPDAHAGPPALSAPDTPPSFAGESVNAQLYATGTTVALALPTAAGGNAPLTYSLSPAPPPGLTFYPYPILTLSGTPATTQTAAAYTLTATDANGDTATLSFNIAIRADYDADNDQLLEVGNLAQLDAIRYDLNGNGKADNNADESKYAAAFPNSVDDMGCPLVDHDDNAATAKTPVCAGYELTQDLDFDTDDDGATYTVSATGAVTGDAGDTYYNGGQGWTPIGSYTHHFTATFDGNGKTVSNLFIKDARRDYVGLFGNAGAGSRIERLGVRNLNITGRNNAGGLVGRIDAGAVSGSYASGALTGNVAVGGLVGRNTAGPISGSYAAISVIGNDHVGGLAGINTAGPISGSYATGAVIGSVHVGGLVGGNSGPISASYAIGAVTGSRDAVGGLVGNNGGAISGCYATGAVTGNNNNAGGLVGWNAQPISASYAAGPVTGKVGVGGLVGGNYSGDISASYAIGAVTGSSHVGGLVGWISRERGTVTNSYWDTGATGQTASSGGAGKTTRDLQSLTGYTGIYANWNANLDGIAGNDDPWDFGVNRQYPALKYGGLEPAKQRQTSIQSDNWNAPVVGEPVTAGQDVVDDATAAWQWQSSPTGAAWTDIAGAAAATYLPVAADAASGGKFLRAQATFTVSGASQTLTTINTAKALAASTAAAGATLSVTPVVGVKLRYDSAPYAAASATHRTAWRWQRCDDAAMTANCQLLAQSNPNTDAHTEYTPSAGTDTDVGKYLRAYAYYADTANSSAWTRTQTPVLGPVIAAPPPSP